MNGATLDDHEHAHWPARVDLVFSPFPSARADLPKTGRLHITTESRSRYEIDLTNELLRRIPGDTQPEDRDVCDALSDSVGRVASCGWMLSNNRVQLATQ
jgi:hypothetical protein